MIISLAYRNSTYSSVRRMATNLRQFWQIRNESKSEVISP